MTGPPPPPAFARFLLPFGRPLGRFPTVPSGDTASTAPLFDPVPAPDALPMPDAPAPLGATPVPAPTPADSLSFRYLPQQPTGINQSNHPPPSSQEDKEREERRKKKKETRGTGVEQCESETLVRKSHALRASADTYHLSILGRRSRSTVHFVIQQA